MYLLEVKNTMEYYDFVLVGILASITLGAATGLITAVPVNLAVGAGALLATPLMYHSMFLNAPSGTSRYEAL